MSTNTRRTQASVFRLSAIALVLTLSSGCDQLLTQPANLAPDVSVSFTLEGTSAGGSAEAFARVTHAFLRFTRTDGAQRDTIIRLQNADGVARARLAVATNEQIEGLGIYALLGVGDVGLFEGAAIVRIRSADVTTVEIPLTPIASMIEPSRASVIYAAVGDTARLSFAVLFASRDTIPGAPGTWTSIDPSIVAISPAGLSIARAVGQTDLIIRSGSLADTIPARVVSSR